jgi:uncharacterized protein YycO
MGVPPHVQWPPSKWGQKVTLIAFFIMTACFFRFAHRAKQVKVTGTVTDTTGEVLTGVAVRVKGSQAVQQLMLKG